MTNKIINEWIDVCESRGKSLWLSNEYNSWTYGELSESLRKYKSQIEELSPDICILEGDYSLQSVSFLITCLCFGWQIVPVVSKNENVIKTREEISEANYRFSEDTNWNILIINDLKNKTQIENSGVILFSSGSTGIPKAMCKDMQNMLLNISFGGRQVCMGLLLLFDHIGGLNTLFSGMKKGAHLVAPLERSPRKMAELIQAYSVRVLPCSPTFLNMMYLDGVFDDYNFKSLRLVTYGTERMPEDLLIRLSEKLPRVKFLQTFGTSETGIVQTKSLSSSSTFLTIDDPNVDWKIKDNELWLKSSDQIKGYINTKETAINDGWFKTGDLVEMKDENYFRIIGRKNEIINVGGEKVLPSEIEDFVMSIGDVVDCTAFSVPNKITGQAVGIRVVCKNESNQKNIKKNIRSKSREKLENFKTPVKIIFDKELIHTERFKKERNNG